MNISLDVVLVDWLTMSEYFVDIRLIRHSTTETILNGLLE
jgi:hypothetical protein